jgi:hypothetical protein
MINPSLLRIELDGTFSYCLHYDTFPYEGHLFRQGTSVRGSMKFQLEKWIQGFEKMKKKVSFCFSSQHAISFMDHLFLDFSKRFDVIETSNLADHVGLLNLLVSGSNLLKNDASLLKVCSFLLFNFAKSREEYLAIVTGMPKEAYPTLLGVELYENLHDPKDWTSFIYPFEKNITMSQNQRKHETFLFFFPLVYVQCILFL